MATPAIQKHHKHLIVKNDVLKEEKITVYLKTTLKDCYKIKIDWDVLPQSSPEIRCDYLVLIESSWCEYFIELKWKNHEHWILQLKSSIEMFWKKNCKKASYLATNWWPIMVARTPISIFREFKRLNSTFIPIRSKKTIEIVKVN